MSFDTVAYKSPAIAPREREREKEREREREREPCYSSGDRGMAMNRPEMFATTQLHTQADAE